MGYDIITAKTKKDIDNYKRLSHIQCQYAYQGIFKKAFGREILEWNGRLTAKNKDEFLKGIDNLLRVLDEDLDIPMYLGNISNRSQEGLKKDFEELKELIIAGKIGYIWVY